MGLFDKMIKKKAQTTTVTSNSKSTIPTEKLMTSQLPAFFLKDNNAEYHDIYIRRLKKIGFNRKNAEKMFEFECDIIRRHDKQYLLQPQFTKLWLFGLRQPFFSAVSKNKRRYT